MTQLTHDFLNDFINSNSYSQYLAQVQEMDYISMRDTKDLMHELQEQGHSLDDIVECVHLLANRIG